MDERTQAEGQYQSLPLEGRIDLMRPRQEEQRKLPPAELAPAELAPAELVPAAPETSEKQDKEEMTLEEPHTPTMPTIRGTWQLDLPPGSPPRMHTLPTPAPHEIPSTPYMRARSLPPSMPPTPSPHPSAHDYPQSMTTEQVTGQELFSPPPDSRIHEVSLHPQPEEQQEQPHDRHHRHPHPKDQRHRQQQQQAQQPQLPHHHRQEERPRPSSPPLVTWNPAIEPPPKDPPPVFAFPVDTYFPNIWDQQPSGHPDDAHQWGSSSPDSSTFFKEPTPSEIPETLVRQGHYRGVTGEQEPGASPSPDRTKVKRVFPWEDKPRHLPGRLFPSSESPLPGAFLVPGSPGSPERHPSHAPSIPSPLVGLPSTLNYTNVWDAVPSIQRYASRLVRPSPSPQLLAPAFEVGRRRRGDTFRSWSERAEVSSRDGDDEDNADESEEADVAESPRWTGDSGSETGSSRRRSSSLRTLVRPRKEYVSVGVQTDTREMRCQAVQVDLISPPVHPPQYFPRPSPNGMHPVPPPNPSVPFKPTVMLDTSTEPEPMTTTPPLSTRQFPQSSIPSRSRPSHESMYPASPTRSPLVPTASPLPKLSPQTMTPPRSMLHTVPSSSVRTLDSPSIASPLSSVGPLSPPEGLPVPLPPRKGSRVWDPARGVELLRRGSEEVLARFLKMGSTWEEDVTTVHGTQH
jgi:glycogenin glucosyltransferase